MVLLSFPSGRALTRAQHARKRVFARKRYFARKRHSPQKRRYARKRLLRDLGFFTIIFVVLFGGGYLYANTGAFSTDPIIAVVLICAFLLAGLYWRRAWHTFANRYFVGAPQSLANPWVIDGDTIDDRATGVRYRLANIDAPEIDGAKCYREAERGQLAKSALVRMVREAQAVTVRKTFRIDQYGRRVAFLLIDGKDAGAELMAHACKKCRAFN